VLAEVDCDVPAVRSTPVANLHCTETTLVGSTHGGRTTDTSVLLAAEHGWGFLTGPVRLLA
jgi:hypothetical protein